ncbi:MAG: hypothetical protein ACXAC5_05465 [Promethearchaeota archaeon]
MDDDIKYLYLLLCKPKGTVPYGSRHYVNGNVCKNRFTAKNNIEHVIANWNLTCIDIYKDGDYVKRVGLLPEYLWPQ